MYPKKMIEAVRIKGTALDRRLVVTDQIKEEIKKLRKENLTQTEIALIVGVSQATVGRMLMSKEQLQEYNYRNNQSTKRRYHSLSTEEKTIFNRKYKQSKIKYRSELLDTKFKNIGA